MSAVRWAKRQTSLALLRIGRIASAARMLERLVDADISDSQSRRLLAWALARLDRHEESALHHRDLMEEVPWDLEAPRALAENLLALQRPAEALALLRIAAEREPDNSIVQYLLGTAYTALGQGPDALAAFRRAVSLSPDDADALHNLAVALNDLEHWNDSLEYSRKALAIQPRASTHREIATSLACLKRWDEAVASFRQAVALQPEWRAGAIELILALLKAGQAGEANRMLDALRIEDMQGGIELAMLSLAHHEARRTTEAAAAARAALEAEPTWFKAHSVHGWASLDAGLAEAALASFRHALQLAPADVDAKIGEASALSAMGDHAAALAGFKDASDKWPDWLEDYPEVHGHYDISRSSVKGNSRVEP